LMGGWPGDGTTAGGSSVDLEAVVRRGSSRIRCGPSHGTDQSVQSTVRPPLARRHELRLRGGLTAAPGHVKLPRRRNMRFQRIRTGRWPRQVDDERLAHDMRRQESPEPAVIGLVALSPITQKWPIGIAIGPQSWVVGW